MQKKTIGIIGILVLLVILISIIGINVIKPSKEEPKETNTEETPKKEINYNDGIDNKEEVEQYLEENFHKDGYTFEFVKEEDEVVTYNQVNKKTKDTITYKYDIKNKRMMMEQQEKLTPSNQNTEK